MTASIYFSLIAFSILALIRLRMGETPAKSVVVETAITFVFYNLVKYILDFYVWV